MQDSWPNDAVRQRPKPTLLSQILVTGSILLVLPVLFEAVSMPNRLQAGWCPQATFQHGMLGATYPLAIGLMMGMASLTLLPLALGQKFRWLKYRDGYSPPEGTRARQTNRLIIWSAVGLFISGVLWLNTTTSYFCVTPDEIILRSGYLDAARQHTWNDVKVVYGYCTTGKYGQGGEVRLAFDGGDAVPVSLAGGGHVNMAAYDQVRRALDGKDYRYYVNKTVTPDQCPTELYPLLWNWLN